MPADQDEPPGDVLVLDDDPTLREAIARVLRAQGLCVVTAETCAEAEAIIARGGVQAALLDVVLPDGSGLDLCQRIRAERDALSFPIVLLTGHHSPTVKLDGLRAGADEFLDKPFSPAELILRVNHLLRGKKLHERVLAQNDELQERVRERGEKLDRIASSYHLIQGDLLRSHEESIRRLARAAEYRDPETGEHLERVSRYAEHIAQAMGIDRAACEQLRLASRLHDVGKLAVPDRILLKPGRLTDAEFAVMQKHTVRGFEILSGSGHALLDLAASIAHTHHERFDGHGYPRGLAGEDIPIEGRIVAVADVFDALSTPRPYKRPHSLEASVTIIREGSGTAFDPRVVDAFLGTWSEIEAIHRSWPDASHGKARDHDERGLDAPGAPGPAAERDTA
ncbi:MAG: response regulator [Deltaproteobacteria bacterium]|nr:response regulator [Deltaproteobacteria bacterium]